MKVSVIVCTCNRAYAIIECLDSVAQAIKNAAPLDAELVVVDNASTDNTSALVSEWAKSCAFPVQLRLETKRGIAAARNCGIRNARGDLLAFTDDDCRLTPEYIKDLLRHDAADTAPVLRGGRVELGDPTDLPVTVKTEPDIQQWSLAAHSAKYANLSHTIIGCNMAMRREVADRVGFFDERLGAGAAIPSGEDMDYVFRAYMAGVVIQYVPDMCVAHFHGRKKVSDVKKLFHNYMLGTGALYAKYLFKNLDICRPAYWDFKKAVRELFGYKDEFLASIGFSYRKLLFYCVVGAAKYGALSLRKRA